VLVKVWGGAWDGCAQSPSRGLDEGIEDAFPDCFGWRVDAGGGQRVLLMGTEEDVDFRESGFDFSDLDVESFDGALATAALCELAASYRPVSSEPPEHDTAVEEFADSVEVLRREAPIDDHRAIEPVQGLNKGCRRCASAEQGKPFCRQSVPVEDAVFLHIEMEESFVLFEPLAEGGFSRSWDAGDKEVHAVSLAFLSQGGRKGPIYKIWKRDKEKIKKSSRKDKVVWASILRDFGIRDRIGRVIPPRGFCGIISSFLKEITSAIRL